MKEVVTMSPSGDQLCAVAKALGESDPRNYMADLASALLLLTRFNLVVHPSQIVPGAWCAGQCKGMRGESDDLIMWSHTCVTATKIEFAIYWAACKALDFEQEASE